LEDLNALVAKLRKIAETSFEQVGHETAPPLPVTDDFTIHSLIALLITNRCPPLSWMTPSRRSSRASAGLNR